MSDTIRDTVILGSGCAGLTAAIYTARANLKPLVLEGHEPGGQLSITTLVENFPGWPEGIQGPELIENMKKQAARFGAEFKMAHLSSVDLAKPSIWLNTGQRGSAHAHADYCFSGASARWLGLPSGAGADWAWSKFAARLVTGSSSRGKDDCGDRRRRLRDGGGAVSDALCIEGDTDPSARAVPRFEDHAGARDGSSEDRVHDEHDGG